MKDFASLYTTLPSEDEAGKLARKVVETRLAACANIVPGVRSLYHWQGSITEEGEAIVFFKTRSELIDDLMAFIRKEHPYDVPALMVFPIERIFQPYAEWLDHETRAAL